MSATRAVAIVVGLAVLVLLGMRGVRPELLVGIGIIAARIPLGAFPRPPRWLVVAVAAELAC